MNKLKPLFCSIFIGHIQRGTFDIAHPYEEYQNRQEYVRISKSTTK